MSRRTPLAKILPTLDRFAWLLSAFFIALGSYFLVAKIITAEWWPNQGTDMSVYLAAARAVSSGQNMYDPALYPYDVYGYPPLFAEIIAVARLALGDGLRWFVWMCLLIAALFVSLAIMMRGFGRKIAWKWVVLVFSVIFAGHIARSEIFHMQPHFFLLLLILLGLRAFNANKPIAGGFAWGAIFVCKPFTGVMVLWLMRRGEWRAAFTTLAAATALFVGSFLPFLPNIVDGVKGWMSASSYHTGWPNIAKSANETFYGLFHRLFGPETTYSSPWVEMPGIVPVLAVPFVLLAIVGIYLGVTGKSETLKIPAEERGAQDLLQIATVLGFSMSCGPLMESPHCFMLLPGLIGAIMLTERRWRDNAATKWRWFAASAAWVVTFFWLAFPISLPITNLYSMGHITGLKLLITMKMGVSVLASCLLSVFALLGDRAAQRAAQTGVKTVPGAGATGVIS